MLRAPLARGDVRGTISKTVLAWTDTVLGQRRTDEIAREVGARHKVSLEDMRSSESAMSYLVVEDLYPKVIAATGDKDAIYKAGVFSSNMQAIGVFIFGVVKILGGTRFVYQKTAELAPRFANTGIMTCTHVTERSAILEFEMFPELNCTLAGFDYRRGLFASTPMAFGAKTPAKVTVLGCQAKGDKKDVFKCEW
jgi:hypothetical protein